MGDRPSFAPVMPFLIGMAVALALILTPSALAWLMRYAAALADTLR